MAEPLRHRCDGPVRHVTRDHGSELGSAIAELDAGFDPIAVVCEDEQPCLVELLVVIQKPTDLERGVLWEVIEQSVTVVVNKPVRRRSPEVTLVGGNYNEL